MSDIITNNKLDYLEIVKSDIKSAIIEKGQEVSDTDTFRSYADKIRSISGGGSNVEPEITVLLEPMTIGMFEDTGSTHPTTNDALYRFETDQAPVAIEKGKTYIVDWDEKQYTVSCKEFSHPELQGQYLYLGDGVMLSSMGLPQAEPSAEPFVIMQATLGTESVVFFIATSTKVTHDFGLSLVEMPSVTVEPLTVTKNGTYTAPEGTAYSPVTVNVAGGGGGGSTNWVSAMGEEPGTGADLVIEHNLGVIPDIIYYSVYPQAATAEQVPVFQIGFSRAMMNGFGEGFERQGGKFLAAWGDGRIMDSTTGAGIDELKPSDVFTGGLCSVNETTFTVKYSSSFPISSAKKINWYAIGGITGN